MAVDLFAGVGAAPASTGTLDAMLAASRPGQVLDILFLWGIDCPN